MKRTTVLAAVTASLIALGAFAHGGATGVVKERMDGMSAMKEAVKVLTPIMQGQTEYDAAVVRDQAAIIAAHGGEALTELFPEGSLDAPSEARDTIWQDWEDFSAMAEQLRLTSEGLAAAADNGLTMSGEAPVGGMMGSNASGAGMMGAGMMGGSPGAMDFAEMPAEGAFMMMGQVCSACHTRFRVEK